MDKKLTLIFSFMFLLYLSTISQTINKEIEAYYQKGDYKKIIKYADKYIELSDTGVFYIGLSYYALSNDSLALEFYNKALHKNVLFADIYKYKAISLAYIKQKDSMIISIDKAIELEPENADFYSTKGDLFGFYEEKDSAFYYYKMSVSFPNASGKQYSNLASAYLDLDSLTLAKENYKKAKVLIEKSGGNYLNCLFNLGNVNYLLGDFAEAEKSFIELTSINIEDYHATAKLIQCYNAQNKTKRTAPLIKMLYKAYKKDKLPENMKKMYCFAQFIWKDKRILAYENFDSPKDKGLYYKHVFYIPDEKGEYTTTIQTEWSYAVEMAKKKYVLGMNSPGRHQTFWQFTFDEKVDYKKLKKAVIEVLEKNVTPTSSSTYKK